MIGIEVYVKNRSNNLVNVALKTIFEALPKSLLCYPDNYELVLDNISTGLPDSIPPQEIAALVGATRSLLTCGRFFCYRGKNLSEDIEDFDDFYASDCQTIVLVYDVASIEIYSKDEAFLFDCLKTLKANSGNMKIEPIEADTCFREGFQI